MKKLNEIQLREQKTAYIVGFGLSIFLTCIAFMLVGLEILSGIVGVAVLSILALLQLGVQTIFFLHLGREKSPHWNTKLFALTGIIVFILVAGTLWVMANLDYHTSSKDAAEYLLEDQGIKLSE